jgi:D-arabinose 1-dehydrogenase-like Zn-dependent alcohol dehydrogenase
MTLKIVSRCAALTAYNALLGQVPVKAGDYVLVLGTGGVSMYALTNLTQPSVLMCYLPVLLSSSPLLPVL